MSETTTSEWHSNRRDYDARISVENPTRAELFGRAKQLLEQYEHVVVEAYHRPNAKAHTRKVNPNAIEYDPERDTLDITGFPATGRFVRPDTFSAFRCWE